MPVLAIGMTGHSSMLYIQ